MSKPTYQELEKRIKELEKVVFERTIAEDKLLESKEFHRAIFDQTFQFIGLMTPEGILIEVNRAALHFQGLSEKDVIGKFFWDTPWWSHSNTLQDRLREATKRAAAGKFDRFEAFHLDSEGEIHHIDVSIKPLLEANGNVCMLIPEGRDITERKKAEEALSKSQTFNETILNTSPDAIYIYDIVERKNIYSNDRTTTVLGYSTNEITEMGDTLLKDLMHPDDFQIYQSEILPRYHSAKDDELIEHEYRMKHKDGDWHWLHSREYIFLRQENGTPRQIFGLTRDITKRRRTEDETKDLIHFQESIIDNANVWLNVLDKQANVKIWNKAAEMISGYSSEEVIGHGKIWEWLYPDINYRNKIFKKAIDILKKGEILEGFETVITTKNGEKKTMSWYSRNLMNKNGEVESSIALGLDITERNRAEERLETERIFTNTIIQSLPDLFYIIEKKSARFIRRSDNWPEITDYSEDELDAMTALDIIGDKELGVSCMQKVYDLGSSSMENTILTKSGKQIPYYFTGRKVIIDSKEYLVGMGLDISERKNAEEALKESEERYRYLAEGSIEAIFINKDLICLEANNAAAQMFGYVNISELIGINALEVMAPESHEIVQYHIANNLPGPYEAIGIRRDGKKFPVEISAKQMPYKDEGVVRVTAVRDISLWKEVEERFRLVAQATTDMFYEWDVATDKLTWFSDIDKMLGYEPGEISDTIEAWIALIHPEDQNQLADAVELHRTSLEPILYEYRMKMKDGTWRHWLDIASPILSPPDADGRIFPVRWVGGLSDITKRKEVEERFRLVAQTTTDMFYEWDVATDKLTWFSDIDKMLGYEPGEISDTIEAWIALIHPEDQNQLADAVELHRTSLEPILYEYRMKMKDGTWRHWLDIASPILSPPDANRKTHPVRWVGGLSDITKRKKVEEELRESEEHFRIMMEQSPIGTQIFSLDGLLLKANKAWADLWNVRDLDMVIGKYNALKDKQFDNMGLKDQIIKAFKGEIVELPPIIYDPKISGQPGRKRFIQLKGYPLKNNKGELKTIVVLHEDITDRKMAAELLKMERDKLLDIFKAMKDGVYISDENYDIRYVNPLIEKEFGPIANRKCYEYFHKIKEPCSWCTNEEVLSGKTVRWEWYSEKNEKSYDILDTPIKNADGTFSKLAIFRDITEQKHLEEQLQVRQRMDSLGTLAGGIAHDFNNMLVGIMGNIDLLLFDKQNLTGTQKERLADAEKSCVRAKELIQQFHSFSKVSLAEKSSIDIYDISKEVVVLLENTTDKLIKKSIEFEKGQFFVNANSTEINQVLLNLGINSAHAIEQKGIQPGDIISVDAEEYIADSKNLLGLSEGDYIHITFRDNGTGMSDEVMRKAFDPLYTTKDKGVARGQGLGLSMVFNIVTRIHDGHIYIESEEGIGTTFHIYLPKALPETIIEENIAIDLPGGNETILVVDDEEMVRKLAEIMLITFGYKVMTAEDGQQALEKYQEQNRVIDAVILDLTMPRLSGEMVLRGMLEINPDVKVIISSGHSEVLTREGILSKAKSNINKPYTMKELAKTLRAVLDS